MTAPTPEELEQDRRAAMRVALVAGLIGAGLLLLLALATTRVLADELELGPEPETPVFGSDAPDELEPNDQPDPTLEELEEARRILIDGPELEE